MARRESPVGRSMKFRFQIEYFPFAGSHVRQAGRPTFQTRTLFPVQTVLAVFHHLHRVTVVRLVSSQSLRQSFGGTYRRLYGVLALRTCGAVRLLLSIGSVSSEAYWWRFGGGQGLWRRAASGDPVPEERGDGW